MVSVLSVVLFTRYSSIPILGLCAQPALWVSVRFDKVRVKVRDKGCGIAQATYRPDFIPLPCIPPAGTVERLLCVGGVTVWIRHIAWALCVVWGCMELPVWAQEEGDAAAAFRLILEEDWERGLEENPMFATRVGDHRFNGELGDASLEAIARRNEWAMEVVDRLAGIEREALPPSDRVDYDIFLRMKEEGIREHGFRHYLIPITNRSGFHASFPELPDRVPLRTASDYRDYIRRLEGFLVYAREHIEVMRAGIAEGMVLPRVVLEGVEEVIEAHLVDDPADSRMYSPFEAYPDTVPAEAREKLTSAGREAIVGSVVAGYREFLAFMEDEYLPAARESVGASDLPDGRAFYAHRVRRFTTLELSADEVHQIGLDEVARIREEMRAVMEEVGFDGELTEFFEFLRTEDRFYASDAEALLKEVSWILKRMDAELPALFGRLPRMPYGIKPVPEYVASRAPTAYYQGPAGDGTKAGIFFINTYDLRSRPLYGMEALALHEAVPGHHLQIALQQEMEDLPMFRRYAGFTAFVEGWALYAERLGLEAGFYQDPYRNFGRLTYEMWRACRLVVDTGLHALGWTRQQAIDYLMAHAALSPHDIETEVDRYISWPGQALAYKIGELAILRLREEAEQTLGEEFDLREFHDQVLGGGAVPLDLLETRVREWAETRQAADREPPRAAHATPR